MPRQRDAEGDHAEQRADPAPSPIASGSRPAASWTEDMVAEQVVCGPDLERHLEAIRTCVDAGFGHVYVHQVGPAQASRIDWYAREILPHARRE